VPRQRTKQYCSLLTCPCISEVDSGLPLVKLLKTWMAESDLVLALCWRTSRLVLTVFSDCRLQMLQPVSSNASNAQIKLSSLIM
jgi:hypothetical protein